MANIRNSILGALISRREPAAEMRRPDFKGDRRRFSLRMPAQAVFDLEIIKVASGEDKNAFVERHLEPAIAQRLRELKDKHGDEAWEFIVARARQRVG